MSDDLKFNNFTKQGISSIKITLKNGWNCWINTFQQAVDEAKS